MRLKCHDVNLQSLGFTYIRTYQKGARSAQEAPKLVDHAKVEYLEPLAEAIDEQVVGVLVVALLLRVRVRVGAGAQVLARVLQAQRVALGQARRGLGRVQDLRHQ